MKPKINYTCDADSFGPEATDADRESFLEHVIEVLEERYPNADVSAELGSSSKVWSTVEGLDVEALRRQIGNEIWEAWCARPVATIA